MSVDHGTYARYARKDGCRCDECKAAKATYMRERRRAAREAAARFSTNLRGVIGRWPVGTERHYVPDVKHGTNYAYYERGCRCPECTTWESVENSARLQRRRQERNREHGGKS